MTGIRVAVIGGGQNSEHEVSLASAAAVARALDPASYDVVRLTIDRDGSWRDEASSDPIGLPAAVQLLQELRGGSAGAARPTRRGRHPGRAVRPRRRALRRLRRRPRARSRWTSGPPSRSRAASASRSRPTCCSRPATAAAYFFDAPVVVKPVAAGSSHGVTLVRDAAALAAALAAAFALDDRVLVEES